MMAIENWSAKERVARFGEYVEIVSQLLSREEFSYQGHNYHVDAAAISPRPVQSPRPPIIVAAMGPVMLGHAARHADTCISVSAFLTMGLRQKMWSRHYPILRRGSKANIGDWATPSRSVLLAIRFVPHHSRDIVSIQICQASGRIC
jgi:hypothetical protein